MEGILDSPLLDDVALATEANGGRSPRPLANERSDVG